MLSDEETIPAKFHMISVCLDRQLCQDDKTNKVRDLGVVWMMKCTVCDEVLIDIWHLTLSSSWLHSSSCPI
jgi:hypothetical protein